MRNIVFDTPENLSNRCSIFKQNRDHALRELHHMRKLFKRDGKISYVNWTNKIIDILREKGGE